MPISAIAAHAAKTELKPHSYDPGALGAHEVEVKVTHCGICHSDLHLIDNDWGVSTYPLVPGHEIVGMITSVGKDVRHLKVGDRVGIGWQCGACLDCEICIHGDENYCASRQATCVGHHGGFATAVRSDARFAFKIPATLKSAQTAPLLCGGVTVYGPMKRFGVRPEHKVGVIGIGGLGHLALRFARAFGCEVTALSSTASKETEAKALGAHRFIVTSDAKAMADAANSLDFIISTVFANLDWTHYLNLLKLDGTLHFVGVPSASLEIPVGSLIGGRRRVSASAIGSRADMLDMLDFAARHDIGAQVEIVPMAEANAAIDKLRQNKARYRMVLANP